METETMRPIASVSMRFGNLMLSPKLLVIALELLLGLSACAQTSVVDCGAAATNPCVTPPLKPGSQLSTSEPSSVAAPKVVYSNGQLTITAMNSTLGDVLRAVSAQTGAAIDFPPASAEERVAVNLGPGAVRDVLQALLNGTRFNYFMLESPENPKTLQRIVLSNAEAAASVATELPAAQNTQTEVPDQALSAATPEGQVVPSRPLTKEEADARRREIFEKIKERLQGAGQQK